MDFLGCLNNIMAFHQILVRGFVKKQGPASHFTIYQCFLNVSTYYIYEL